MSIDTIGRPSISIDKDNNIIAIDLWHKINGKYVHIAQIYEGEYKGFYTDGVKEKI